MRAWEHTRSRLDYEWEDRGPARAGRDNRASMASTLKVGTTRSILCPALDPDDHASRPNRQGPFTLDPL